MKRINRICKSDYGLKGILAILNVGGNPVTGAERLSVCI